MRTIRTRTSPIDGLACAASTPATAVAIMLAIGQWDAPLLALALAMSLPLYLIGRDAARD
jgi:hypothetical protein